MSRTRFRLTESYHADALTPDAADDAPADLKLPYKIAAAASRFASRPAAAAPPVPRPALLHSAAHLTAHVSLDAKNSQSRLHLGSRGHLAQHLLRIIRNALVSRRALSPPAASPSAVRFRLRWDFDAYIDHHLQGCFDDLDQAITLTTEVDRNGEFNTLAVSCADYVRRQWPAHGLFVLGVLKRSYRDRQIARYARAESSSLAQESTADVDVDTNGSLSVSVAQDSHSMPLVTVRGSLKDIHDVCHQLCWLTAVCRNVDADRAALSRVWCRYWRTPTEPDFLISAGDLEPLSAGNEDACWHVLFANMPVAFGFAVPERLERHANSLNSADALTWGHVGVGLDISFDLMKVLAGAKYPLDYKGGIVLRGPQTLLIPTGTYGNVMQWHLYHLPSSPAASANDTHKAVTDLLDKVDWFKTSELSRLTTARTFLGYASPVTINLGTLDSGFAHISRSRAPAEATSLQLSGLSGSAGSEGLGFFGASFGASFKLSRGLRANIRSDYLSDGDRLHRSKLQPTLLYDEATSRAWLVPELSVILHCLHSWASSRGFGDRIPFADAAWDGGQAALSVIERYAGSVVETQPQGPETTLLDKVRLFFDMFEQRKEMSMIRSQEEGPKLFQRGSSLLGWDYSDLIEMKSFPQRKQIKISASLLDAKKHWPRLLRNNPDALVILCRNLGSPIRPARDAGRCRNCAHVPEDAHLLTASMGCLRVLNSSLHPKGDARHPSMALFKPCEELETVVAGQSDAPPMPTVDEGFLMSDLYPQGAITFGGRRRPKRLPCEGTRVVSTRQDSQARPLTPEPRPKQEDSDGHPAISAAPRTSHVDTAFAYDAVTLSGPFSSFTAGPATGLREALVALPRIGTFDSSSSTLHAQPSTNSMTSTAVGSSQDDDEPASPPYMTPETSRPSSPAKGALSLRG